MGTLISRAGENLILAGRCLSAEHEGLASARVTAQCFGYGHAAGIAASEAVTSGRPVRALSGEEIHTLLNTEDAQLDV